MYKITDLSFHYQTAGHDVLQNIDLVIKHGDFLGIIGPNGCGKTTLLKCMAKNLKPQVGIIRLMDVDLRKLSPKEIAKKLGVVPQKWHINFSYTVEELVAMGRFAHEKSFFAKSSNDQDVIQQAMEMTGVQKLSQRSITQLSGGELQRVIIAQALAQNPQILLLDEATSNLDINHQIEIMELMKRLNEQQGLTVVTVMHDLNLAAQYCQKLLLLHNGEIFTSGSPQEVLTAAHIRTVYNTNVRVRMDPLSQRPMISFFPNWVKPQAPKQDRVHVIGGGGRGTPLLELLTTMGYQVSCGVINRYDADWVLCQELGITTITEAAFSPISEQTQEKNLAQIQDSQMVIIAHIPIGHGNLANLYGAKSALENGIPLLICDFTPISERDFTNGEGTQMYNLLLNSGAIGVKREEELYTYLSE